MNNVCHSEAQFDTAKRWLEQADAVLIGAGAGFSTAAGLQYGGARFTRYFADIQAKYGLTDMYSTAFYPFATPELTWGYWCRHILVNRYEQPGQALYAQLKQRMQGLPHHVITTNADGLFAKGGFAAEQIFSVQGDYGKFQCAQPCHDTLYDNEQAVRTMVAACQDGQIPTELIPQCPRCGGPMAVNVRKDSRFVQDNVWYRQHDAYLDFVQRYQHQRLVLIELGIGFNTPSIIKYPFDAMVQHWPQARLLRVNLDRAEAERNSNAHTRHWVGDAQDWLARLA
ncbi:Sir2 silent information regulator family NAD-dependent deacetylase [Ferrimonas pelagia]|uniref:Deacetylase sirtuin-type domain-containing protein n=1 Tax=Ferrimonas pelagia TaxID=1177826 RepID=A0ABP9EYX5_9GAMM